jgi:hypothetical protein
VPSLTERRQRRRGLLLLAAAAAVVTAVVVPTVDQLGSRSDDATSAGSAADSNTSSSAGAGTSTPSGSGELDQGPSDAQAPLAVPEPTGVVALTRAGFVQQVRRTTDGRALAQPATTPTCAVDDGESYGAGSLVAATYDGTPVVLAYRPPGGAGQRVDLLACGSAAVIRTTTLPAS